MGKFLILCVEDDRSVSNLLTTTLKMNGYEFFTASSGMEAISGTASRHPDLILMDLGLPDIDGVKVIRKIRTWSRVPVIVISARGEDADKIEALDAGADDYLTKPFSVDELLARIRAAQRRLSYAAEDHQVSEFDNGPLHIDYAAASISIDGESVHLTPNEYKLLVLLAQHVGKVMTHSMIIHEIWGGELNSDIVSLRVHMASLRRKLHDTNREHPLIRTHLGIGYSMVRMEEHRS